MQQDPIATSTQQLHNGSHASTFTEPENGSLTRDATRRGSSGLSSGRRSPSRGSAAAVNGPRDSSTPRHLSDEEQPARQRLGQRITEYERALSRSSTVPQQPLGFKVVKRPDGSGNPEGAQLMDLPNEVLTRIVTQLRPDARAAASMVCKRLREVIMTPYAWQLAFVQHFPGTNTPHIKDEEHSGVWANASDVQVSYQQPSAFARITPQATWRSEFLLRSELMQGLSLGRPGIGKESGGGWYYKKAKKSQGTLIYYPRRSRILSHLHVLYGKDASSRAIHGSSDAGLVSMSDPSNGRVDRWGDEDDFDGRLVDDLSDIELYGMGERSLLIVPNPMDVSAAYGRIGGEGFPRGRAFFRGVHANTQRVSHRTTSYLVGGHMLDNEHPTEVPDVADLADGISSVWVAKSSDVPATTRSMIGILTGTTSGVVTAYSLAPEGSPNKGALNGCITTRWVVSPGVPIVAFQVDDQYSVRRKRQGRVWAVALNALGEVFYLDATPKENLHNLGEKTHTQLTMNAWDAGRSIPWRLLEQTRRTRKDEAELKDDELMFGTSAACADKPGSERLRSDAANVNRLCRLPYWHFHETYAGWDMQRKLEVDFSSDDGSGAGELIFVMDSGMPDCGPAGVRRFTRSVSVESATSAGLLQKEGSSPALAASIFARTPSEMTTPLSSGTSSPLPRDVKLSNLSHTWTVEEMSLAGHKVDQITASAMDKSLTSLMTFSEDPLLDGARSDVTEGERSPLRAIPGGRARNLVVGTSTGAVLVWNGRAQASKNQSVRPLRVIQTTSKEITAVAATAIYVVHGGSDGLAQAWDPLASTLEPLHTIHNKNAIRPSRNTHLDGRRLTKEDMNIVRAISVDPNPLLLRGCLTCGPGIHSWSFCSQGNVVKRKRRMRNIHGRPANRRTGTEISEYIAGEEAEVQREQKERAAEFERLKRNFGLGELTEEEAIVYAQMLSQEAAEAERLRDEQLLQQSESEAELMRLSRQDSHDDHISDDTASVDTGYMTSSDVASSHDPLDIAYGGQSPRSTYIASIADDRGVHGMYSPAAPVADHRNSDYPITFKTKQDKHRRGKKNKRQGSSSASSTSGDGAGPSAVAGLRQQYYGHTATASFGSEGDFSVSGLSADEQLALALRLSAVQEEGETSSKVNSAEPGVDEDFDEFPSLADRETPGKGKGKASTASPASWGQGLASSSGMTEDEELALALKMSMQAQ